MNPVAETKVCPICSGRLERDGLCLACLLNEGLAAEQEPTPQPAVVRTLSLPCEFAGYRLVREIASGGMGIVYEAEDVKLRRVVALKLIRNAHFATREEAARFRAETQAVAQLDHPDIIPIYESGEEDGMPYFTMRLAEGGSLADRIKKRGVMPDREAATLLSRIARAVQHAHDHGVLHRDLKPANILLDVAGKPMLSDFGLAKLLDAEFQLTRSNAYVGTPHFMSPEQAAGRSKEVTIASDVWALGVMLYQMLTDKLPFQGGSAVEVMRRITQEEPEISSSGKLTVRSGSKASDVKPTNVSAGSLVRVQQDLATLILRCLEKQPARRLPSAGFLADELDRFLAGKPLQSRPVGSFERLWKLALRNKAATFALLATSVSMVAGTVVSVWQAKTAEAAKAVAIRQKMESDDIAAIVLDTVNGLDEETVGRDVDPEAMRLELLRRVGDFQGDPERKALMLTELSSMMKKPADLARFRNLLTELEPQLGADSQLLWDLRYRVALKTMHLSPADGEASSQARDELQKILAWQRAHLDEEDPRVAQTEFSLADELIRFAKNPQELQQAEALLLSACERAERTGQKFNQMVTRIELMTAIFGLGRHEEALKLGRATCAGTLKEFGGQHALTARAYGRLARHCREAGLIEESITHGRRALDIYWHSVGPGYVKALSSLNALAETLTKKGDHEGLLRLRQEALRTCDQQLGPLDKNTQLQAAAVVEVLRTLGRLDEALAFGAQWLDRVRVDGHLRPEAAPLLMQQSFTQTEAGKHEQAETSLKELLGLLEAQVWDDHSQLKTWASMGRKLMEHGRPAAAAAILQRVIKVPEQHDIDARQAARDLPTYQKWLEEARIAQTAAR